MARQRSDSGKSLDKTQLRDLLLRRSPDALNRWVDSQEPGDANIFLRDIAEDAHRTNGTTLFCWITFLIMGPFWLFPMAIAGKSVFWYFLAGCVVSSFIESLRDLRKSRAGVRAVALLAERGDDSALLPLAKVWGAWDKERILSDAGKRNFGTWMGEPGSLETKVSVALNGLMKRAYPPLMRFNSHDFSDADADILLAALRCLMHYPDSRRHATVRRVARFPVPKNAPNRALLQEVAILFLDDPKPVVPLERRDNAPAGLDPPSVLPATVLTTNATVATPEQEIVPLRKV